jgi:hypothetical protein
MLKGFSIMVGLAALCLTLAAPAMADAGDERIAQDVARAVRLYSGYEMFDWVEGNVENGIVTLTGAVRLPQSQIDMTTLARRIPGVKAVRNEIRVLPLSSYDDQIRRAAALSIYRDPQLAQYITQAQPAVHFIVENGRIELKGVVLTTLDKRLVADRVRNSIVAFEVKNHLEVEAE